MKKLFNILFSIIALALGIAIVVILHGILGSALVLLVPVLLGLGAVFFLLIKGKSLIIKEKTAIEYQTAARVPVHFSKKKVVLGYIMMFSVMWLFMPGVFLIPANIAWIYILPPVGLFYLVMANNWKHQWCEFGFKKRYYFLMHFLGLLIPALIVFLVKTFL